MIRRICLLFITSILLSGCRVNNGDIGNLFGSWLLYSMTVDGETPADFNPEKTFWEFQNNIIFITAIDEHYDKELRIGTWSEEGNRLLLDFTHHENGEEPGTGSFLAPAWLYMPSNSVIALTFISSTSDRMSLTFTDDSGHTINYYLRKIW